MKGYTTTTKDLYFAVDGHTTAQGATPAFLWQVPDKAVAAINGVVYQLPPEPGPALIVRGATPHIQPQYDVDDIRAADLVVGGSVVLVQDGILADIPADNKAKARTVVGIRPNGPNDEIVFLYVNAGIRGAALAAQAMGCVEAMQLTTTPSDKATAALGAVRADMIPSKIVMIDPAHGGGDQGATGCGIIEKFANFEDACRIAGNFKDYDVLVLLTRSGDVSVSAQDRATLVNAIEPDALVTLHRSEVNYRGYTDTVWDAPSVGCLRLRDLIRRRVATVLHDYKIPDRGSRQGDSHLFRSVKCPVVMLTWLSVQNPTDAMLSREPVVRSAYCQAVALGIVDSLGISKKLSFEPSTLYRVQVGLFQDREKAEELVLKLESLGFEVFLVGK